RLALGGAPAERRAGQPVGEVFPALRGLVSLPFEPLDAQKIAGRCDVALSCLHHGTAAPAVTTLRKAGVAVVDLSADFRLRDLAAYERWYGPQKVPALFCRAVFV